MKKILSIVFIFAFVFISCKAKQKIDSSINNGGGGGHITPPVIATEDELKLENVLKSIVSDYDNSLNSWRDNSDWKNHDPIKGKDLPTITNGGFFVANYSQNTWLVFAINNERNIYIGLADGYNGKLQEAVNMLEKDGQLNEESWDPRKLVYNDGDDAPINIAWLGRARWDYRKQGDKYYKGYDNLYPNPLKYLSGNAKTYSTLKNFDSVPLATYCSRLDLRTLEVSKGGIGSVNAAFPLEAANGEDERRAWTHDLYEQNNANYKYHGGRTVVATPSKLRFAVADKNGGYPSAIGEEKGKKATPGDADMASKQEGGKYYDKSYGKYNTIGPKGKIMFYRTVPEESANNWAKVQFLNSVVAYNIRMKDSQNPDAATLFGGKYDVKEVIFEFDSDSFDDITADSFSINEIPIRYNKDNNGTPKLAEATYEINTSGGTLKTHKIPLLYFSPK